MARLSKIKRQHTNYSDKTIKRALELLKNNTIQNVHQNTKIPISTLRTWKSKEDKSQKLDGFFFLLIDFGLKFNYFDFR